MSRWVYEMPSFPFVSSLSNSTGEGVLVIVASSAPAAGQAWVASWTASRFCCIYSAVDSLLLNLATCYTMENCSPITFPLHTDIEVVRLSAVKADCTVIPPGGERLKLKPSLGGGSNPDCNRELWKSVVLWALFTCHHRHRYVKKVKLTTAEGINAV